MYRPVRSPNAAQQRVDHPGGGGLAVGAGRRGSTGYARCGLPSRSSSASIRSSVEVHAGTRGQRASQLGLDPRRARPGRCVGLIGCVTASRQRRRAARRSGRCRPRPRPAGRGSWRPPAPGPCRGTPRCRACRAACASSFSAAAQVLRQPGPLGGDVDRAGQVELDACAARDRQRRGGAKPVRRLGSSRASDRISGSCAASRRRPARSSRAATRWPGCSPWSERNRRTSVTTCLQRARPRPRRPVVDRAGSAAGQAATTTDSPPVSAVHSSSVTNGTTGCSSRSSGVEHVAEHPAGDARPPRRPRRAAAWPARRTSRRPRPRRSGTARRRPSRTRSPRSARRPRRRPCCSRDRIQRSAADSSLGAAAARPSTVAPFISANRVAFQSLLQKLRRALAPTPR